MDITFDGYISNPAFKNNSVYSHREMYRELYKNKLDKILVREIGKVKYILFIDKAKDEYYVLMKVPSEVIEKFYYDTVIQFSTTNNSFRTDRTLKDYNVKFFSNDPSFIYSFGHAMLQNDLFIKDLLPRMSKDAITNIAKVRNPKDQIGYVKSIYFTYLLMKNYGLFNKIMFSSEGQAYNQKIILSMITHSDIKIAQRQEEQEKLNKIKRLDKDVKKSVKKPTVHTFNNAIPATASKFVNTTIKKVVNPINKNIKSPSKFVNKINVKPPKIKGI